MKVYRDIFKNIISPENLFSAWDVFRSGKGKRRDVMEFQWNLEENIFELHHELKSKTYKHGLYSGFYINDPKQRHIHKATVRDRILHHAVFSIINPIFEPTFIPTSFSCRVGYGTHRGINALETAARGVGRNNTRTCFVLKCDIEKFFDSVNHETLLSVIGKRIKDRDTMWLLESIVESYRVRERERERERERDERLAAKGIPIGNLTSQIFANIYMSEFDQFIKHDLNVKYYFRYTDDFTIVAESREYLEKLLPQVSQFLEEKLALRLHPKKIIIRPLYQGVDFLGFIIFSHHRLLRTKTKRRIFAKFRRRIAGYREGRITKFELDQSLQSYLGVLFHADTYHLAEKLKNELWF